MNATIVDLLTERLARRGTSVRAVPSDPAGAETCRVLVLDRRALRARRAATGVPTTGPGRRADGPR